jgi:hypothetical protein
MRPRVKGAALLLLAFGLGGIEGALGFNLYQTWLAERRPLDSARSHHAGLQRLPAALALRPEQQERVEAILREAEQEVARLREEIDPRVYALWTHARVRIRSVLDADQQAQFNALMAGAGPWAGRFPVPRLGAYTQVP